MYDIIGDVHGNADALKKLLQKLGYSRKSGFYSHPDRKGRLAAYRFDGELSLKAKKLVTV